MTERKIERQLKKYEKLGFNERQIRELKAGLESGIDVRIIAKENYDNHQMKLIREKLESKADVSLFADPKYDVWQMTQISNGLDEGIDVSTYADPKFDWVQMNAIRRGLLDGVDAKAYADPKYSDIQMNAIRLGLKAGVGSVEAILVGVFGSTQKYSGKDKINNNGQIQKEVDTAISIIRKNIIIKKETKTTSPQEVDEEVR
jgi:hypothetical protein